MNYNKTLVRSTITEKQTKVNYKILVAYSETGKTWHSTGFDKLLLLAGVFWIV